MMQNANRKEGYLPGLLSSVLLLCLDINRHLIMILEVRIEYLNR